MNSTFEESKDLSRWSKASWIDFAYGIEEVQESGSVLTNVYILEDDFSSGTAMMGWGNNSTRQAMRRSTSNDKSVGSKFLGSTGWL